MSHPLYARNSKRIKESLEQILGKIGNPTSAVHDVLGERFTVNSSSLRLKAFKHYGTTCVRCGRTGTHFRITPNSSPESENQYHLSLFSDDNYLITIDHIVPLSAGGCDNMDNLQPMCQPCNSQLGDKGHLPSDGKFRRVSLVFLGEDKWTLLIKKGNNERKKNSIRVKIRGMKFDKALIMAMTLHPQPHLHLPRSMKDVMDVQPSNSTFPHVQKKRRTRS